ncbi:MAG: hypothetical protein LAN83_15655 [Acidobacteriia bacterium]|nr:hypothetical protein [Terriglobia bacterium]
MDANNNKFGKTRLIDTPQANRATDSASLLSALVAAVQRFSSIEQSDELMLVVARAR